MARSTDINQRIVLTGDDEVRRKLDALGAAGTRAFDRAGGSSKQLGFAVRNLGFQVNDLVTSFASGGNAMQIFAQQGGQIVQAFQQGGGPSAVFGGVATKLKEMITPMRALAGVGAAAAAGVAVLGARAISADSSLRQFKVTLDALRAPAFARGPDVLKGLGISPEDLEAAAKRLRSAGLSLSEARKEILEAVRAGVDPKLAEQVIRFGKDLDASFGEKGAKSAEAFRKAIQGGPATLRQFGVAVGQINPNVTELQDGLRTVSELLRAIMNAPNIKGAADRVLDPLSRKAREVNVDFQNLLDRITLFGKEGLVNLVSTGGAAVDMFKSLSAAVRELNFTGIADGLNAAFEPLRSLGTTLVQTNLEAWRGFFAALPGLATTAFTTIRAQLAGPDPLGLNALATAAVASMQQLFQTVGDTIIQALATGFASADPFAPLVAAAQTAATTIISILQSILDFANKVASAVSSAISAGGATGFGPGGFAAGGLVRGPGTGTSDSVPAWLSQGEFVMRTAAVRHWGTDFLSALNGLNAPLVPRSRGFAAGGLVGAAAGGGGTVVLNLDGQSFETHAQQDVFESLKKVAGRKQLLSAGRRQSWMGGRRYGG
jgi:hypothetical protein